MIARLGFRRITATGLRCRAFHSSSGMFALSQRQMEIVKSTAPVLADHGIAITSHFYKSMLQNRPELKNIFNIANQETGAQPAALAHAVWAYASNIDNLGALTTAVSRIGNRHASLGITPDQYPIVGEHLLASIKEILGDAVDEPVLDAWRAAYQQLADIFIDFEKDLYDKAIHTPGGWNGWRQFKVARKLRESGEIISFHLAPSDGKALPAFTPGQFPRQYSLSDFPNGDHFRISVKREFAAASKPAGRISNVLHETIPEGSLLDVSMPYGDFTLDINTDTPVVLISGGVGLTPMMSMLKTIVEQGKSRPVLFIHAVRNRSVHAMNSDLTKIISQNPQVSRMVFYEELTPGDVKGFDYDYVGRINVKDLKDKQQDLESLGVPPERIHSEVFGAS
ncbi:bacterial hemoglobin [Halenospora varia]|nr:bacterial hemoglobin [Halenospora varia]